MKCTHCNEELKVIEAIEEDDDSFSCFPWYSSKPKEEYVYSVLGHCASCETDFKYKVKLRTVLDSEYDLTEIIY